MRILYFTGQIVLHGGIEKVTVMKLNYWVEIGNDVYLSTYEQGDKPLFILYHQKFIMKI